MIQTVTAKIKICPSRQEAELLVSTMKSYTRACNFVSSYIYQNKILVKSALHKKLYRVLRSDFGLKAQMAESVFKTVLAKYQTEKSNHHGFIQPVFKKQQYDLVWNRDYSLVKNLFSVNTLAGRIKLPFCIRGMEPYFDKNRFTFGGAKLVCKHKKFFLHISVKTELAEPDLKKVTNIVGIDRGVNFIAATYDSNHASAFLVESESSTKGHSMRKHAKNFKCVKHLLREDD